MKVLVTVKRAVDYNVKVKPNTDNTDVDIANAKMAINPFCEIAVEEAVRLKEAGAASEVVVVSVGPSKCQEQLRAAMALGADRAILVESEIALEPLGIAKVIAKIAEREKPELIITGKQSIDGDNNQTGQMLAAKLNWPQATFASKLELEEGSATVTREIDGGLQTIKVKLPAVITTDLRLNEPRFAALPNIMKAKKKPLEQIPVEDLGIDCSPRLTRIRVEPPAQRKAGIKVASVSELIDKLKNDAKVIP